MLDINREEALFDQITRVGMCWQSVGRELACVGRVFGKCWHVLAECRERVGKCWHVLDNNRWEALFDQITHDVGRELGKCWGVLACVGRVLGKCWGLLGSVGMCWHSVEKHTV